MILEQLRERDRLKVTLLQPLVVLYKDLTTSNNCWDTSLNKKLDVKDIDDSYGLDVVDSDGNDIVEVLIPKGAVCTFMKTSPSIDCTVRYKNIECDLTFDNMDDIDCFFEVIDE